MRTWHIGMLTGLLVVLLGGAPQAPAQSEEDAVKKVIQDFAKAQTARDVNLAASYVAEDAKIDSRSAGRQLSKTEWAQRLVPLVQNPGFSSVQVTRLKVSMADPNRAVVDGEFYVYTRGGQSGTYHQWILEKREGKWLIVETKYK